MILRPYHVENTNSRPITEVKQPEALPLIPSVAKTRKCFSQNIRFCEKNHMTYQSSQFLQLNAIICTIL